MPRADDLRALLARVESATGRDLYLEAEMLLLLGGPQSGWPKEWFGIAFRPTEAIDDAVSLIGKILPGYSWAVAISGGRFRASVTPTSPFRPMPVIAKGCATGGLVLCAALLSALIARETQHGPD